MKLTHTPDKTEVFRERFVHTEGFTTRYLEAGENNETPVMLLHDGAWGGASDVTWGRCIPILAERYHVIAPDFLGFGGSDKVTYFDRSTYAPRIKQITAVLASANVVEPVHVIGASFGGSVAVRLLPTAPFPLKSVTSIGGSGGLWKTPVMQDQLGRWDGTHSDLARVVRYLMTETDEFTTQVELRLKWAHAPGHYRALASAAMPIPDALRNRQPDHWLGQLRETVTPTLLVAGEHDELFEPDWAARLAATIPNSKAVILDSRHLPQLDRPDETSKVILDFLDEADQ
ncbi:alpha/beta fold hydrolase [Rhodococcus sp. NPDC056960]|uniref:alpha/beta fold hydrolase n=1 Tax=Rhodococcus TaxID=1827 RepID=UPI00363A7821